MYMCIYIYIYITMYKCTQHVHIYYHAYQAALGYILYHITVYCYVLCIPGCHMPLSHSLRSASSCASLMGGSMVGGSMVGGSMISSLVSGNDQLHQPVWRVLRGFCVNPVPMSCWWRVMGVSGLYICKLCKCMLHT